MKDRLYDLAYAFKESRLWQKLWDSQAFAVQHDDGSIGYCCVMGRGGMHVALAVYPGLAGLHSLQAMSVGDEETERDVREVGLRQDCVMLSFVNKEQLLPYEHQEITDYLARRGKKARGARAFAQFERFVPGRVPWDVHDTKDLEYMAQALQAALEVSRRLEDSTPEALGLYEGILIKRDIPLLVPENGGYAWRTTGLPTFKPPTYPGMDMPQDDLLYARLTRAKKTKLTWALQTMFSPRAYEDEESDRAPTGRPVKAPAFPMLLLIVSHDDGMILNILMSPQPEDYPREFARQLADLIQQHGRPKGMLVMDDRTQALLDNFCKRIQIPLTRRENIDVLEDGVEIFLQHFEQDWGEDDIDAADPGMAGVLQAYEHALRSECTDIELAKMVRSLPDERIPDVVQEIIRKVARERGLI